ncbi:MAG: hypothetical protein U0871_09490 [Gemmataceae bacterium]
MGRTRTAARSPTWPSPRSSATRPPGGGGPRSGGSTPAEVRIVSARPLEGEDDRGTRYRVRRRHLRPTVPFPDELPRGWLTPAVRGLAEGVLADRGWDRTPILADALEEAGADHPALLAELRAVNECNWGLLTVAGAAGLVAPV